MSSTTWQFSKKDAGMLSFLVSSGVAKPISLEYITFRKKRNTSHEYFYLGCVLQRHLFRFPAWGDSKFRILSGKYFGSNRNIFWHSSNSFGGSSGGNGGNNSGHSQRNQGPDGRNNPIVAIYLNYISALEERPVLTKAITTSLINAFSDLIAQWLEQKGQSFCWNLRRTFALGFWGLIFMGPFFHNWYLILERLFPSGRWAFLQKIILDQTFAAALFNVTFYIGTGFLEGNNWQQIVDKMRQKFWPTMYANWRVWPLIQCITFTWVPLTFRVLWVNMVTVLWVIYFSSLAHSH